MAARENEDKKIQNASDGLPRMFIVCSILSAILFAAVAGVVMLDAGRRNAEQVRVLHDFNTPEGEFDPRSIVDPDAPERLQREGGAPNTPASLR